MPSPGRSTVVQITPAGWCALALVLLLPWAAVVWVARPAKPPAPSGGVAPSAVAREKPAVAKDSRAAAGPWGRLSTSRILIEPPEDFIPPFFTTPQPVRWVLKGYSAEALDALWREAGFTTEQRQALTAATRQNGESAVVVIEPPLELVLGLAPSARAKLYGALAAFPENIAQRDPFRSRADAVDDWFEAAELPDELVGLTRRLLYPRNGNLLFSDHDVVLPRLTTRAERVRYVKALSRKSALLVQLQIEHGADIEALARYWGRGRRSKDVAPLLQSVAQLPNGGALDIVHLLPAFARLLLYTYPVPSERPADYARDCHWTSLNFFNVQPDDRFMDVGVVQQTLLNDYYQVGGEPAMGDIIMLVQAGGQGVHSCVHVADDIVFTKNGAAFSVPWTLARLDQVVAFYSLAGPLEIRRYRAK